MPSARTGSDAQGLQFRRFAMSAFAPSGFRLTSPASEVSHCRSLYCQALCGGGGGVERSQRRPAAIPSPSLSKVRGAPAVSVGLYRTLSLCSSPPLGVWPAVRSAVLEASGGYWRRPAAIVRCRADSRDDRFVFSGSYQALLPASHIPSRALCCRGLCRGRYSRVPPARAGGESDRSCPYLRLLLRFVLDLWVRLSAPLVRDSV